MPLRVTSDVRLSGMNGAAEHEGKSIQFGSV